MAELSRGRSRCRRCGALFDRRPLLAMSQPAECRWGVVQIRNLSVRCCFAEERDCSCHLWIRRWFGSTLMLRLWTRPQSLGYWRPGRSRRAPRCTWMTSRCCRSSHCVRGFATSHTTTRTPRPYANTPISCGDSSTSFTPAGETCSTRPNQTCGRTAFCGCRHRTSRSAT